MENNYFEIIDKNPKPKKFLKHCIVCHKKKHLVYYGTVGRYITQICNKCLNEVESAP